MQAAEKKYEDVLKQAMLNDGWFVRKLHGNVYQSGLPDLLVRPPGGQFVLIEMKGTHKPDSSYTATELFAKLKGPQVGTILLLAKQRAKVGIILGGPTGFFVALCPFKTDLLIEPTDVAKTLGLLTEWQTTP